ncbi:MAG TPA: GNAT family N-acetyltransferase [Acetobacteraceae bacterium]|nr:GNAT family N-acetyltransferase [Acetobacteraceae bacterium]
MSTPILRQACPGDLEPLIAMQQRSMRNLGADFYRQDEIEAYLAQCGTMDPRLIRDGTYYVVEAGGRLAGGAGWTLRRPNYHALLMEDLPGLPGQVGMVRSIFVDPGFTRQGLGHWLMAHVELAMYRAGIETAELMGTLPGMPLCRRLGYEEQSRHALQFEGGIAFAVRRMVKPLSWNSAEAVRDQVMAQPVSYTLLASAW